MTEGALINLKCARAYLADPDHWAKGSGGFLMDHVVKHCVVTAIGAFNIRSDVPVEEINESIDLLIEVQDGAYCMSHLMRFNDQPETTHEMVLALYDRAIAQGEAELELETTDDRELVLA